MSSRLLAHLIDALRDAHHRLAADEKDQAEAHARILALFSPSWGFSPEDAADTYKRATQRLHIKQEEPKPVTTDKAFLNAVLLRQVELLAQANETRLPDDRLKVAAEIRALATTYADINCRAWPESQSRTAWQEHLASPGSSPAAPSTPPGESR